MHVPVFLVLVTSGEKTEKSNRLRKLDTRVSLSSSIMLIGLLENTVAKYGALIFDLYTCFGWALRNKLNYSIFSESIYVYVAVF